MTLAAHIQGADLGARVTLYELDLTMFDQGVIRLAPGTTGSTAVGFGYNGDEPIVYAPHPIRAEGFELTTNGPLPRPSFEVANLDNSFTALVEQNDDLQGGILRRIRTYSRYLNDGEEPDSNVHLPIDVYQLSLKTKHTTETIGWDCSALMDQEGVQLPGRQIIRDYCDHVYRRWDPNAGAFDYAYVTCPYAGNAYYDENDQPVAAALDRCSKRLTGCRLRFGENGVLPTRAFPGVARLKVR